jgi:hypothetical protein
MSSKRRQNYERERERGREKEREGEIEKERERERKRERRERESRGCSYTKDSAAVKKGGTCCLHAQIKHLWTQLKLDFLFIALT